MTYIFAWNYTPDPSVSSVKRAVQAYIDFRDKKLADANDVWSPHAWENRHIAFYVDGKRSTPKQAAQRLKELPVLTWAHPYHYDEFGTNFSFSPEAVKATIELVKSARVQLRSWIKCGFSRLTASELEHLNNVVDFEGFNAYDKLPVVTGASFAVKCDHASTACHLFGEALRNAGFVGPAANYDSCHGPTGPVLGGSGHQRQTPNHVPGSLDGKTTFLTTYEQGGPWGCLTYDEVYHGLINGPKPLWVVLEDYQDRLETLIKIAKDNNVELLGLWGTDKTVTPTGDQPDRTDIAWAKSQDQKIHNAYYGV